MEELTGRIRAAQKDKEELNRLITDYVPLLKVKQQIRDL